MAAVRLMMPGAITSTQGGHLGATASLPHHASAGEAASASESALSDQAAMAMNNIGGANNRKLQRKLEIDMGVSRGGAPSGGGGLQHGVKRQRCGGAPSLEDEVSPQDYLHRILVERGYEAELLPATHQPFFQPPQGKQIEDYDMTLVGAIKRGDLDVVRQLATTGRRMDACNKHGESIVHISCRRGNVDILRFLLENGARVDICDDLGRTPLHDACWAKDPVFDCVVAILERDLRLLRVADCRGASPLAYIKRDHWAAWRQFFDMKKEEYWAHRPAGGEGRTEGELPQAGGEVGPHVNDVATEMSTSGSTDVASSPSA